MEGWTDKNQAQAILDVDLERVLNKLGRGDGV